MAEKPKYDNNKNCYKCGADVEVELIENYCCKCGAVQHYRKTCKKCGFVSVIHRHYVDIPELNGQHIKISDVKEPRGTAA